MGSNGNLASSELRSLATNPGQRLAAEAAAAWDDLNNEYKARHGKYLELTDSYRPLATQKSIFLDRYKPQATGSGPYGDVRHYNGTRYVRTKGAAAAIPGTSNHGLGKAVDVKGATAFGNGVHAELSAIASTYGYSNAEGRSVNEPWHFTYVGRKTYRDVTGVQRAVRATADNVWGPDTDKRVDAVREASAYGGREHPYGVAFTQGVVGATADGVWGAKSNAAHDATVKAIQAAVGVTADGVWGAKTQAAVDAAKAGARRP